MEKLKRLTASNFGENVKQPDSHTLLMGMYNGTTALWERIWKFLINLKVNLPHHRAVSLIIYPRDVKINVH